jgi:hypothetical protein
VKSQQTVPTSLSRKLSRNYLSTSPGISPDGKLLPNSNFFIHQPHPHTFGKSKLTKFSKISNLSKLWDSKTGLENEKVKGLAVSQAVQPITRETEPPIFGSNLWRGKGDY